MLRRYCIKSLLAAGFALLFAPWRAWAGENRAAFSATRFDVALSEHLAGRTARHSEEIVIRVEPLVENGAVVPIKIHTDLTEVRRIAIFVEKNPNPLIASFDMGAGCKGFIATRIKIGTPSNVVAVVETNTDAYRKDTFVEVVEGGCT